MDKVTATLVRNGSGQVDVSETIAKFQADLDTFLLAEQADLDQIAGKVTEFWNANKGINSVSIDALASAVFASLAMPLSAYAETTARIKSYIRATTDTYGVMRGKDGGVSLLSRLSDEDRAKVIAQREKLAEKAAAKKSA